MMRCEMIRDEEKNMAPQEETEATASLAGYYEDEQNTARISEDKAEAIAVRLSDISSVIKNYIDLHPDRYLAFLNGEREKCSDNPTPLYPTKFREKKK